MYRTFYTYFLKNFFSYIPYSLVKSGIKSNLLRIDNGKHFESSGSVNLLLQDNKFHKQDVFLEGEVKYPVKTVKFVPIPVHLELNSSASLKIAFFDHGNKASYSIIPLYSSLNQIHSKLDTLTHDVQSLTQKQGLVAEKQDLMLDVSHEHHCIETSKFENFYNKQVVFNQSRFIAMDFSLTNLQSSMNQNSEQVKHCCLELKNSLAELCKDKNNLNPLAPELENISPFGVFDFLKNVVGLVLFTQNTKNIVIYFCIGGMGSVASMIVQTALVHPITQRNLKLTKSLSVVKMFLSAFYWSSLFLTAGFILNNFFAKNNILAKNAFIEKQAAHLINLPI